MENYGIGEAAALLGTTTDTLRRWVDQGRVSATKTEGGQRRIDGESLARFARSLSETPDPRPVVSESARNRFTGIVTNVAKDKVMAQVELQAG
ncbi:MAG: MerR family transcriptional regulator, partial [Acidimicrobiales bacterium]